MKITEIQTGQIVTAWSVGTLVNSTAELCNHGEGRTHKPWGHMQNTAASSQSSITAAQSYRMCTAWWGICCYSAIYTYTCTHSCSWPIFNTTSGQYLHLHVAIYSPFNCYCVLILLCWGLKTARTWHEGFSGNNSLSLDVLRRSVKCVFSAGLFGLFSFCCTFLTKYSMRSRRVYFPQWVMRVCFK